MPVRTHLLRLLAVAVVLAGGACVAPPPGSGTGAPATMVPAGTAVAYEVTGSDVTIRVYRDGPLARLGHNHVIASTALSGRIELADPVTASTLDLSLPLGSLQVDDPARRAAAGADFPGTLTEADREGTRRNMLGPALLDAARFPVVRLASTSVEERAGTLYVTTRVDVAGRTSEIVVPAVMETRDGTLSARGAFTVTHAELGLTPFSVGLGALRVGDGIEVAFTLAARRPGT